MIAMQLLILGLGYTGTEIARRAVAAGIAVTATSRTPDRLVPPEGVNLIRFGEAAGAIQAATHILQTAPPDEAGDPALARFPFDRPRWVGVLGTTGVYGDRGGAWWTEDTPPAPTGPRGQRRLDAEHAWTRAVPHSRLDLFRVAGIYGPHRSVLDEVRAGRARRVDKPGHLFGRIHRDDIATAVLVALQQPRDPGPRILNLADDEPAANADVTAYAARLLRAPEPPIVAYEAALAAMSPMGRSFWAENRRVASRKTQQRLGLTWRYPTYREGLQAILAAEAAVGVDGTHEQPAGS